MDPPPGCVRYGNDRGRIRYSIGLDSARDLLCPRTIAERETNEFERGGDPLIAEVGDDQQIRKLLAQLLDQEKIRKGRDCDKHNIDLAIANDARSYAREHRKPGDLRVRQEHVIEDPLQEAGLLVLLRRNLLAGCRFL